MKKILILTFFVITCVTNCIAGELQKVDEIQLYNQLRGELQAHSMKNLLQEDYYGYQHGKNSMYGYAVNILKYDYKNNAEKQIALK